MEEVQPIQGLVPIAAPKTRDEDEITTLVAGKLLACIRSRTAADRGHWQMAQAVVELLKAEKLLVL
jgi:hypothetical protein